MGGCVAWFCCWKQKWLIVLNPTPRIIKINLYKTIDVIINNTVWNIFTFNSISLWVPWEYCILFEWRFVLIINKHWMLIAIGALTLPTLKPTCMPVLLFKRGSFNFVQYLILPGLWNLVCHKYVVFKWAPFQVHFK